MQTSESNIISLREKITTKLGWDSKPKYELDGYMFRREYHICRLVINLLIEYDLDPNDWYIVNYNIKNSTLNDIAETPIVRINVKIVNPVTEELHELYFREVGEL